jgi:hypothetical protein
MIAHTPKADGHIELTDQQRAAVQAAAATLRASDRDQFFFDLALRHDAHPTDDDVAWAIHHVIGIFTDGRTKVVGCDFGK